MTAIGSKIREARQSANMTQSGLARELEVEVGQVNRWENGKAEPRADTLDQVATVLGKPVGFFFEPAKDGST